MMKAYYDNGEVLLTDGKTIKLLDESFIGEKILKDEMWRFRFQGEGERLELYHIMWALSDEFHKLYTEEEFDDYNDFDAPFVERELPGKDQIFFELDDPAEIAPAEGKYAKIREFYSEDVERLARAIRPADNWNAVEDEVKKIIRWSEELIADSHNLDFCYDDVMGHAEEIFGVQII